MNPMNMTQKHLINTREYTSFSTIADELTLKSNDNFLFDLDYLSVLDLHGDKTVEFLQGQLSCDINKVTDVQMIQGAQCNLKGRILCLMDVIQWSGIKLIVPKDLRDATLTSLSKTSILSKVSITANQRLKVYGFLLQNSDDIKPDCNYFPKELYALSQGTGFCYYHLGNGFYIFIVDTDREQGLIDQFIQSKQMLGSLAWHSLRLKHQQIEIYPESRGLFLPHRLNLHQTSYLSFDKGCYKGQEIIARTHYRATIKHDLKVYQIKTSVKLHSGIKLIKDDSCEFGEIVDFSLSGDDNYVICVSHLKEIPSVIRFEGSDEILQLIE